MNIWGFLCSTQWSDMFKGMIQANKIWQRSYKRGVVARLCGTDRQSDSLTCCRGMLKTCKLVVFNHILATLLPNHGLLSLFWWSIKLLSNKWFFQKLLNSEPREIRAAANIDETLGWIMRSGFVVIFKNASLLSGILLMSEPSFYLFWKFTLMICSISKEN